jgi:hypothetical protein
MIRIKSPRTVQQMQPLAFAVLLGENAVEEGGLAGAEIACENGDRNL